MKLFYKFIVFILLICVSQISYAINLQMFHFSNSPGFTTLEDGLLSEGFITTDYQYIVVGSYNYVRAPFIEVDGNERTTDIIEWMHTFNFGGAYRFSDDFQIGASTFTTYERAIPVGDSEDDQKFVIGDTVIDFKYKLYEKNKFAISFTPKITVPTGDEDYYTSSNNTGYYIGFAFDKAYSLFQVAVNIGHKENSEARYLDVDHRRQLHFSIGTIVPLVGKLDLTAEFFRDSPYDSGNDQIPSEINGGIRYNYSNEMALFAGVGSGSLEESNSTDVRSFVGLKYFPSSKNKSSKILKEEETYGKLYRMDDIYFDTGSSDIKSTEESKLKFIIARLLDDPFISKIVIEGYASRIGSYALNKKLSRKRSETVKAYLLANGIKLKNVEIVAYGNERADMQNLNKSKDRKVMVRVYRYR